MREWLLRFKRLALFALWTASFLLCASCGNEAAAVMKLARTEGTVSVRDQKEKELEPKTDMNLYSGYQLNTKKTSYSWINLDSVKLAKMDEESDIEIQKSGKELEILLKSGNLFFHVTEPLEADKTMNIRTSNMMVGIRGTCGFIKMLDTSHIKVYLLEGTVECSITDPDTGEIVTETVTEGEMAQLVWKDGEGVITVEKFTEDEIPFFVAEELDRTPELKEHVEQILTKAQEEGSGETENDTADDSRDEEADEEGPIILTTNINDLQFLTGNRTGNVIVTIRDGLYGAVNLKGEEIVPNIYSVSWRAPNNEGQFALGNEDSAIVFDNQGNVILEIPAAASIRLSENAVTYSRLNEDDVYEVGCYDIAEGRYTMQTMMAGDGRMFDDYRVTVSGVQDGSFYYSGSRGVRGTRMHQVKKDGSVLWTDEEVEAELLEAWTEKMLAAGGTIEENDDGYIGARFYHRSEDGSMGAGGGEGFFYVPGCPVHSPKDGYLICDMAWDGYAYQIYDCSTNHSMNLHTAEIGEYLNGWYPGSYYSNGQWYVNHGSRMVLQETDSEGVTSMYLVDFSGAQTDYLGNVTNAQELILAKYPSISLSEDGYYLASDGEEWFYLDENGDRVDSPRWKDCSDFYDGYAAVIEDDDMAYIVDKDFEKMTEGFPADSVYLSGEMFCFTKGDMQTCIFMR